MAPAEGPAGLGERAGVAYSSWQYGGFGLVKGGGLSVPTIPGDFPSLSAAMAVWLLSDKCDVSRCTGLMTAGGR